jgi:hypothetical protein
MPEKFLNTRIKNKHDIEANWLLATNFTPLSGEIIIYNEDENYNYKRIKIGNGIDNVNDLDFIKFDGYDNILLKTEQELTYEEKCMVLANLGLTDIAPKTIVEPEEDDIPKVFINGTIPTTKDEVSAEMTYISKTLSFNAYIEIKCQGNSSMSYPKKNFTIKLFEDAEHASKKKINFKG